MKLFHNNGHRLYITDARKHVFRFFYKMSSGCFKCHGGKALRMEKALHRPVYTRILIRVHKKKKKKGPVFFWKDGVFSFLFHFILFLVKIIWKCQHSFQKNGEHSYFATEIQASLWIAQEFRAKTTQSAIQKLTLQKWEVVRLTHALPKTQS